jgi:hypothetical protein
MLHLFPHRKAILSRQVAISAFSISLPHLTGQVSLTSSQNVAASKSR